MAVVCMVSTVDSQSGRIEASDAAALLPSPLLHSNFLASKPNYCLLLSGKCHRKAQPFFQSRTTVPASKHSPRPEADSIQCGICSSEDEDESVTLYCARCNFIVHLGCMMDSWLGSRTPGYHPSCHHCRHEGAFDAKLQVSNTNASGNDRNLRETTLEEVDINGSSAGERL